MNSSKGDSCYYSRVGENTISPESASDIEFDHDPFSTPLDGHVAPEATRVDGISLPSRNLAVMERSSGEQIDPFYATLLRCPFCQTVFRSMVSQQLSSCPVCEAMNSRQSQTGIQQVAGGKLGKETCDKLTRSGSQPPLLIRRRSQGSQNHAHRSLRRSGHKRTVSAVNMAALVLVAAVCVCLGVMNFSKASRGLGWGVAAEQRHLSAPEVSQPAMLLPEQSDILPSQPAWGAEDPDIDIPGPGLGDLVDDAAILPKP